MYVRSFHDRLFEYQGCNAMNVPFDLNGSYLSPRYIIRKVHDDEYYRHDLEPGTVEIFQMRFP